MAALLLILVLAPSVAAAWACLRRDRRTDVPTVSASGAWVALVVAAVLAAVVAGGGRPRLGDAAWLRADPLGVAMALLVTVLGVTVLTYASRNLEDDATAWRFSALANGLLTTTLVTSLAGRLSLLALGWILTSVLLVSLVGARGDGPARAAARRAGLALGTGDLALIGAVAIAFTSVGDLDLTALGPGVDQLGSHQVSVLGSPEVSAGGAMALLLVVTAAARAAQLPFHRWLPGTLAAPTPVSALLHAGAVNAGGFLLVRLNPVLAESSTASVVLAAIAVMTMVTAGGAALVRTDVKGALATSTSAQMGFMLLAVAVGAPLAAVTHLLGHALYKAFRFLGAGAALTSARAARAHAPRPPSAPVTQAILAVAVPGVVLALTVLVIEPSILHGGEGWIIGFGVAAVGVRATWAWLGRRPLGVGPVVVAGLGLSAAVLGHLGLLTALDHLLADSLTVPEGAAVDAPMALAALLAAAGAGVVGVRWAPTAPWLLAALAAAGPASLADRRRRRSRPRAPSRAARPVLEGAW